MCEELKLVRYDDSPWGFRLTGGLDFGTQLTVVKVTGGSIAELAGVQVGDLVVEINGTSTKSFTHLDAQNAIVKAGNKIILSVLRGSIVTPPTSPLRGLTPMRDTSHSDAVNGHDLKEQLQQLADSEYLQNGTFQPIQDFDSESVIVCDTPADLSNKIHSLVSGAANEDHEVTDLELDELLTGNEEVLDQGVLGINFQKFLPQVDFIRHSEVFKFLQNQNTHKEIPEEVQLQKEPTKRFSTFLQKPKVAPSPKLTGPYWHYPKAPNYLPKGHEPTKEEPKRRPKTEPPPPPEEEGHSVLWLFLGETGDRVIDERWGTPEEERINVSRNSYRTDELSRMSKTPDIPEEDLEDFKFDNELLPKIEEQSQSERELTPEPDTELEEIEQYQRARPKEITTLQRSNNPTPMSPLPFQPEDAIDKTLVGIHEQVAALQPFIVPGDLYDQLISVQEQLAKIIELKDSLMREKANSKQKEPTPEPEEEEIPEPEPEPEEEPEPEPKSPSPEPPSEPEFKPGEFELCEVLPCPPPPRKPTAKPLTPKARPIVLPGGRMWCNPKDAAHDEFYHGILVEQAEVLVGSTGGVNFKKYVPPKFDGNNSAVWRLIKEIEDKCERNKSPEDEYYHQPISKRHFYAATLREPEPIGGVELSELSSDL